MLKCYVHVCSTDTLAEHLHIVHVILYYVVFCGSVCGLCSLGRPDYLRNVLWNGIYLYMYSIALTHPFIIVPLFMMTLYRNHSHTAKVAEIHHGTKQGASERPDPQDQACLSQGPEEAAYSRVLLFSGQPACSPRIVWGVCPKYGRRCGWLWGQILARIIATLISKQQCKHIV